MPVFSLAFQLGIGDIGKAIFKTDTVREPPNRTGRTEKIPKLSCVIEGSRIVVDMHMRVGTVNMGNHEKSVFALCPAHGEIIADF